MSGKVGKEEKMEKIHLLKGCTFQRFIPGGVALSKRVFHSRAQKCYRVIS